MLNEKKIYFAGEDESVVIPSKRKEDGAYDVYANFDTDIFFIEPFETVKIPTKLHSAFSSKYRVVLCERGSTGTKGIAQRAGLIDSGYRGEWLVPITNLNIRPLIIAKKHIAKEDLIQICKDYGYSLEPIIYPYEKAIAQAKLEEVPDVEVEKMDLEKLIGIPSERGIGKLGSSGK